MKRLISIVILTSACSGPSAEQPLIQDSVDKEPRWNVFINRVSMGVYRSYQPLCLDSVRIGHVVEFMNFNPDIPANVTSISAPAPLYSPNLMRPYNFVGPDDPKNAICDVPDASGCAKKASWSFWRHEFTAAGVYDWIDTNQGSPGRKVVDPYYGTETFIGIDPDTQIATVCVQDESGAGCEKVCCTTDDDCGADKICSRNPLDARGRCRTPQG
jgi:hypothetical protein